MQGQIRKIWENESNGKRYWVLNIDDQRYSVWDPKLVKALEEGDYVSYEFKERGNYRSISKIERVEATESPSQDGTEPGYKPTGRDYRVSDKNAQIIRMSALRSAVELLYNSDMPWQEIR